MGGVYSAGGVDSSSGGVKGGRDRWDEWKKGRVKEGASGGRGEWRKGRALSEVGAMLGGESWRLGRKASLERTDGTSGFILLTGV